jgi:hypothetical protein
MSSISGTSCYIRPRPRTARASVKQDGAQGVGECNNRSKSRSLEVEQSRSLETPGFPGRGLEVELEVYLDNFDGTAFTAPCGLERRNLYGASHNNVRATSAKILLPPRIMARQ